jgi:hypothetical protein
MTVREQVSSDVLGNIGVLKDRQDRCPRTPRTLRTHRTGVLEHLGHSGHTGQVSSSVLGCPQETRGHPRTGVLGQSYVRGHRRTGVLAPLKLVPFAGVYTNLIPRPSTEFQKLAVKSGF